MTKPDLPNAKEAYYKAAEGASGLIYVSDDNRRDSKLADLVSDLDIALNKINLHLCKTYNWD